MKLKNAGFCPWCKEIWKMERETEREEKDDKESRGEVCKSCGRQLTRLGLFIK